MGAGHRRLLRLFLGTERDIDREVEDEIRSHLEMRAAALERAGLSPEAARAEAERRFGDVGGARRALREAARARLGRQRRRDRVASVWSDVVLAARRARQSPVQTAISLATFALAIGLTTAGFAIVDRVLVRALAYPDPDRLVALETADSVGNPIAYLSENIWLDWTERASTLASLALYSQLPERWPFAWTGDASRIDGVLVTPGFFETLGVPMVTGRTFNAADTDGGAVIVSESFWRGALGAAALPIEVELANRRRQVVGVIPLGLEHPAGVDAYMAFRPSRRADAMAGESYNWLNYLGLARLAPGVAPQRASAELAVITRAARDAAPEGRYLYGARARPLQEQLVGDAGSYLVLLMAAVSVLLLIACANLAGLGVARTTARSHEMALRLSLGAGRWRLVRQLLTEHLLIALAGGVLGAGVAVLATELFAARLTGEVPRAGEIAVDVRVLAFAVAVSLAAGVLAGVVPALWGSRVSLREGVGAGRGVVRGARGTPAAALVVVEVALALVLLTGGGLLLRSFASLLDRDLGYDVRGVLTAEATLAGRYPEEEWGERWRGILEELEAAPGVAVAGLGNAPPGGRGGTGFIQVEGWEEVGGAAYRVVTDRYFDALGIARLAGRTFGPADRAGTERVTVINQAMAERYWPGESPLGRRVKAYSMEGGIPENAPWLTVIGVVGTIRHYGHIDNADPEMYVTMRQVPQTWFLGTMTAVVRGEPSSQVRPLTEAVRGVFRHLDPGLAVEIQTMERRIHGLLVVRSTILAILAGFATLSLLLAALGLYGLLSFVVARSMHELGIRTALGARPRGLMGLVLGRALRLVAVGAAVGLLAAFWATRLVETLLVDVPRHDALTFATALAVLVVVSSAAALPPALRATRADPMAALRA